MYMKAFSNNCWAIYASYDYSHVKEVLFWTFPLQIRIADFLFISMSAF